MRVLIIGSSANTNNLLAQHIIKNCSTTWDVISSYAASCVNWGLLPNVKSVTATKDIKEDEPEWKGAGMVMEVVAPKFFEKSWVQQRLEMSKFLVVVTISPLQCISKDKLSSFEQILLTKTPAADKQILFHNLFMDTKATTLTDFQRETRLLSETQYLDITKGQLTAKIEYKASEAPPAEQAPKTAPATKEVPSVPVGLSEVKSTTVPVPITCTEEWIFLEPFAKVEHKTVLEKFKEMISNVMITPMFSKIFYDQEAGSHKVLIYIHVHKHRKDLFHAIMMNVIESLKSHQIVKFGGIMC